MRQGIHIELVQGDDYLASDGRAITIKGVGAAWPPAVGQTKLLISYRGSVVLDLDGVFTAASPTADPAVSYDLSREQSLTLCDGLRRYDIESRALLPSGSVVTLARGFATVAPGSL